MYSNTKIITYDMITTLQEEAMKEISIMYTASPFKMLSCGEFLVATFKK